MKTYVVIGLLCAAVVILATGASGLKCYQCSYLKNPITNSVSGENCKDPFLQIPGVTVDTTDCDGKCSKMVVKITEEFSSITRGCSPACISAAPNYCCDGTLCNSAATPYVSKFITLLAGSLILFMWMVASQ